MRTEMSLGLAALLSVGMLSTASAAVVIQDNFDTPHDYSTKNVTGTIWDGVMFNDGTHGTQNTVVTQANASITNAGQLTLQSRQGSWDGAQDDGFFLYRNVAGDFVASVEIISANTGSYHDLGIMARVADVGLAGPGEDWVAARYFQNDGGVILRSTNDGVSTNTTTQKLLNKFFKLERSGDTFTFTSASNASFTSNVTTASVERPDMHGLPLQVGLWQATFSDLEGVAVFDNFQLTLVPEPSVAALGLAGMGFAAMRRRRSS